MPITWGLPGPEREYGERVGGVEKTPGTKITEEGFLAKYYPGTDNNSFGFDFRAYVQSMSARILFVNIASSVATTVRPELNEKR